MDGCGHANIHLGAFFVLIPKEYYSALVRERTLDRKGVVFGVSDPRAGCAGPTRASARNNSRVMLTRRVSDPILADHDLTRPMSFSSPLGPIQPDPWGSKND